MGVAEPSAPVPGRLPDATRLGPVTLQVADLGRSRDYYEQVLGLRDLGGNGGDLQLGAADGRVLVVLRERAGARRVPPRGRLGLFHYALLLPDRPALARFVAHLDASGVPAGMSDHLVSEAIYLSDPDGLGIEVYADRPRPTWQRVDGELAMATEPLDLASLLATAGGVPWTVMPAGTVMGHLHLHVGDLRAAEAFYGGGLGFEVMVRRYPGALFLAAGGYHHHLGTNTWAVGAPPAGPDDAGLLEWAIIVPTDEALDQAARRLAAAGAGITRHGGQVRTRDPWGTTVVLRRAAAGE